MNIKHRVECSDLKKNYVYTILRISNTIVQGDHLSENLENLEMSGNLTAVREISGILLRIREFSGKKILSGKSCLKLFIVNCIFVSIQVFSRSLLCLKC